MRTQIALASTAAAGMLGAALVGAPAQAATANTPVAGVSLSSVAVAPGTPVVVKVTATNTSTKGLGQVALGVVAPLGMQYIQQPTNASCRRSTGGLLYCLVYSLGAGKTATLSFTVTPPSPGTFTFNSYARNVATMKETAASATLTVG